MSSTAKSVVFDIASNNGHGSIVGVRSIEFLLAGTLISIAADDITAYASSVYNSNYSPANAFVTSLSKTGSADNTCWATANISPKTSRLIVVFDSPITFNEIVVNNYHHNGGGVDVGIYSTKITISPDEITDTTYNTVVSNGEVIFNSGISPHASSDAADDDSIYIDIVDLQMVLEQPYNLAEDVVFFALRQVYGLKLESILKQVYRDADKVISVLAQYYHSAAVLQRSFVQPYNDALKAQFILRQEWSQSLQLQMSLRQVWGRGFALQAVINQPYHLPGSVQVALEQLYTLTETQVQAALTQSWSIRDIEALQRSFNQPWGLHDESVVTRVQPSTVTVDNSGVVPTGGSVGLDPISISVEADRDSYHWNASLQLATQAEYLACAKRSDLTIVLPVGTFELFIVSRRRVRRHGEITYHIEAYSKSKLLDAPFAETVSGELTGMASAIATSLAPGFTIDWQTVDGYIPEGTFFAADETPIALIRKLASAAGAVIQTEPGGTITVEPDYPVPVNQWSTSTPDYTLTDALDFFSSGENPDDRPGYNVYLISDQLTTDERLWLEEEDLSETSKYVRGYQTPWVGNFDLAHTGGAWVRIESLSIEEREITEVVEIVAGAGTTRYPIYERLAMEWQQVNLGSVTFAEDGRLETDIEGESLLNITYRTKCLMWLVQDARNEQLQLVVDEEV